MKNWTWDPDRGWVWKGQSAHQTAPALRQAVAAMTATLSTPKRPVAPQLSPQAVQQETARLRAELEQERAAHAREVQAAADERAYVARHGMPRAARERLMEATPLGAR